MDTAEKEIRQAYEWGLICHVELVIALRSIGMDAEYKLRDDIIFPDGNPLDCEVCNPCLMSKKEKQELLEKYKEK